MKLIIILPAYNEGEMIGRVLRPLPTKIKGITNIEKIVIDDGSTDNTVREALKAGAKVISHIINRGLGGAIGTGFSYAKKNKADIVVTFDSDGQHNSSDIEKLILPIMQNRADVVIGSRFLKAQKMPMDRKIINILSDFATYLLFGIWTTDSQSGLRAFNSKALDGIQIKTQKMEVSSEIFKEIKRNNLKLKEIPIKAIYTDYSLKKGQKNSNALPTLYKLFIRLAR